MRPPHDRFRQFLADSGQSSVDVARTLRCNRSYVSLIASGRRRPGLETAVRIERLTMGAVRAVDWVPVEPAEEHAA